MIDRRMLLLWLGGATATALPTRAQQPPARPLRIGMLETVPAADNTAHLEAFRKGLTELGRAEGKTYVIEYRSADGMPERFPALAAELVAAKVDIIVTRGTPATLAAKAATRTLPIVMASAGDPVRAGIVASLARPGGNITGLSAFSTELAAKRVELAKELLPGLVRVGLMANQSNPIEPLQWQETQRAAKLLGLEAEAFDVRSPADVPKAFEAIKARQVGALLVAQDTVVQTSRQVLVDLAARQRLPTIYAGREFVDAGGLMSFRVSYLKNYHRAAALVDKILKGTKPADIPIEQPTTLELVLNMRTAAALGLTIPPAIMARVDDVIE